MISGNDGGRLRLEEEEVVVVVGHDMADGMILGRGTLPLRAHHRAQGWVPEVLPRSSRIVVGIGDTMVARGGIIGAGKEIWGGNETLVGRMIDIMPRLPVPDDQCHLDADTTHTDHHPTQGIRTLRATMVVDPATDLAGME